jgi:hypothetical protein
MSSAEDGALAGVLLQLERQLMDPVCRKDLEQVFALLAAEFREFGSSGRVWTRVAILDLLGSEMPQPAPVVEDFAIQLIGPEAVLVTYRVIRAQGEPGVPRASLRSSLWVLRQDRWQMLFHQGTKIPDA